jgi:integrase/recombinase XerD
VFVQHLRKEGKSNYTLDAFEADLRLVGEFLGDDTPVGQFTTTKLNQFLDWLEHGRGVPCSRKSYARRVTTLKVYFKWLHTINAIPDDPAKPVLQRSGPAPLSDVLSPEQIETALSVTQSMTLKGTNERDYRPELLFRLLLNTGLRKGETALRISLEKTRKNKPDQVPNFIPLLIDDVGRLNPDHPVLMIRQKTKDVYKERRIDLSAEWLVLLDLYLAQYKPEQAIFECAARNLEYILTDIGENARIPFKLSFKVMRWTCAVRDHLNGVDAQNIREKLGLSETSWYETSAKIKLLAEKIQAQ